MNETGVYCVGPLDSDMPTFEYRCPQCGKVQSAFVPISLRDEAAPTCCGKRSERVIITPPAGFVDTPAAG